MPTKKHLALLEEHEIISKTSGGNIQFVIVYAKQKNLKYCDALKQASPHYKKMKGGYNMAVSYITLVTNDFELYFLNG